jgi:hypothetical protein
MGHHKIFTLVILESTFLKESFVFKFFLYLQHIPSKRRSKNSLLTENGKKLLNPPPAKSRGWGLEEKTL